MKRALSVLVLSVVAAACAGSPSALDPQGPAARPIAFLWWLMLAIAGAAFLLVMGALWYGFKRRPRDQSDGGLRRREKRLILVAGALFPTVVVLLLMGLTVATGRTLHTIEGDGTLRVQVIGRQFFWDVRYPDSGAVTANEIHVPVGVRVDLELTTTDVIHSVWVPQLAGKVDMIPGVTNHMTIRADRPGVYRGQCAEYCGVQHTRMAFIVIADPPEGFRNWLDRIRAPQGAPADALAARGLDLFLANSCVGCHTINGTSARGTLGPDLSHMALRRSLGAALIPNTAENLRAWIRDVQEFKPGAKMPPIPLSDDDIRAIVAYLLGTM